MILKIQFLLQIQNIIVYASPQSLVTKDTGPSVFLQFLLGNPHLLSMIVIDKIHLLTDFGRSFRTEFQMLKDKLFQKVKETKPMLFLTVTCTTSIITSFENLIGVTCNNIRWPSPLEMVNWKVRIEVLYTPLWFLSVQKTIKSYVSHHATLPNKVIIYSNSRKRILLLIEKLENYFDGDDDLQACDVLTLVGTQTRAQKATTTNVFINGSDELEYNLDVLCATSGVGNAGIDCREVRAVYRVDFPPSISDISQERGRAGRRDDATPYDYMYQVAISLELFLHLYKRINHPESRTKDSVHREYQMQELMDVASLFASSVQCYYIAIEKKLGNPQGEDQSTADNCAGHCPNCLGKKMFPKVCKSGLKTILFDIFISGPNQITDRRTPQCVWDCIRKYPNSGPLIFRSCESRNLPPLGTIKKVMFQLITSRIIQIQFDMEQNDIVLSLASPGERSTEMAMNSIDSFWDDMKLLI